MMYFKTITAKLATIVRLRVEPITSLAKSKASLEAYLFIIQPPWTVNSSKLVISPSLSSLFSFGNMLRSLTQIIPFIYTHRHERYHSSKLLAYTVIIVIYKSNIIQFKGDERGSHDVFQNNHGQIVNNSTSSCWTYDISCKIKGFSWGISFYYTASLNSKL